MMLTVDGSGHCLSGLNPHMTPGLSKNGKRGGRSWDESMKPLKTCPPSAPSAEPAKANKLSALHYSLSLIAGEFMFI